MAKGPKVPVTLVSALETSIGGGNETLRQVILDLLPLFRTANFFLLSALFILFSFDCYSVLAEKINAADRIIDKHVVLAFIGATAAEISVIIVAAIKKIK